MSKKSELLKKYQDLSDKIANSKTDTFVLNQEVAKLILEMTAVKMEIEELEEEEKNGKTE